MKAALVLIEAEVADAVFRPLRATSGIPRMSKVFSFPVAEAVEAGPLEDEEELDDDDYRENFGRTEGVVISVVTCYLVSTLSDRLVEFEAMPASEAVKDVCEAASTLSLVAVMGL